MKNAIRTLGIISGTFLLLNLFACESSNRETGNEEAAHASSLGENDTAGRTGPDTSVTGVPGNTNAVNAQGNAGNGSGMGSSSSTEAEKNQH